MFQIFYDSKSNFSIHRDGHPTLLPIEPKGLFHEDIFDLQENHQILLKQSKIRDEAFHCGILILQTPTTFGRHGKKALYQCIPARKELPSFIIPYSLPNGFVKYRKNLFVRFRFHDWTDRLPRGQLVETIGPIDSLDAFHTYELYRHSLWRKLPPLPNTVTCLPEHPLRKDYVFTIDPEGCNDFDDAFSVSTDYLSIYISNVPLLLSNISYWDWKQVATIYASHKTRPMLPTQLSHNLCSLKDDGKQKQCIVLDIHRQTGEKRVSLCQVVCSDNFVYEEKDLLQISEYHILEKYAKEQVDWIHDSHDVVAYFMILWNQWAAQNVPHIVYRGTIANETNLQYFPYRGVYTLTKSKHALLQEEYYGHFTSPIRRLVDNINLIRLQEYFGLTSFTDMAKDFCDFWSRRIDLLNQETASIRKIQTQWRALGLFENESKMIPCDAIVLERTDAHRYTMYIKKLELVLKIKDEELLEVDACYPCVLYLVENEISYFRKVRLKRLK